LQGKAGAKGRAGAESGKAAARRAAIEEADDDEEGAGGGDGSGAGGGGKQEQRFDWPAFRADCVSILVKAMAADFRAMWPMGLPEEVRGIRGS
jgi:hypothetical protein